MAAATFIGYALFSIWAIKRLSDFLAYHKTRKSYPPGPTPKPLIGNMFDFPKYGAAEKYIEWGRKYNSDILHAEALGNHVVVLNKREDADALLEQSSRAKINSDRPQLPILKIMGWEWSIAMLPYGEEWRQYRRVCQQNFNPQAARQYQSVQLEKVSQMLQGLLETPKDFDAHSKMFSIALTIFMMYGYEVKSIKDPVVSLAEEAIELGSQLLTPGGSLVNIFPILRYIPAWFPGASSLKLAAKVRAMTEEVMRIPSDFIKKSLAEGTAIPSLVTDFYEKKYAVGATEEEETLINNIAFTVYGAASETTMLATATFFYTMLMNPDVQLKAQAELDRVVGSKRLPRFEDRKSLPYIEAIYREVMRFRPPLPLSMPHNSTQDEIYKGHFIPKGTSIFQNIWAMTHDEEVYADPFSFKPERFFDENGQLNDDDRILAYGFGRRICVGQHVASATVWLLIASVLACFNIKKAKDEHGNDIEINHEYVDLGLTSHKSAFNCSFVVRSQETAKLIVAAVSVIQ